jgi:hypothetical protein
MGAKVLHPSQPPQRWDKLGSNAVDVDVGVKMIIAFGF